MSSATGIAVSLSNVNTILEVFFGNSHLSGFLHSLFLHLPWVSDSTSLAILAGLLCDILISSLAIFILLDQDYSFWQVLYLLPSHGLLVSNTLAQIFSQCCRVYLCVLMWVCGCVCRESVWGVLGGQLSTDSCPSAVMHDVRELETWILRLLSAPVPVPGKTRVEVSCECQSVTTTRIWNAFFGKLTLWCLLLPYGYSGDLCQTGLSRRL